MIFSEELNGTLRLHNKTVDKLQSIQFSTFKHKHDRKSEDTCPCLHKFTT